MSEVLNLFSHLISMHFFFSLIIFNNFFVFSIISMLFGFMSSVCWHCAVKWPRRALLGIGKCKGAALFVVETISKCNYIWLFGLMFFVTLLVCTSSGFSATFSQYNKRIIYNTFPLTFRQRIPSSLTSKSTRIFITTTILSLDIIWLLEFRQNYSDYRRVRCY